jgi:hypothetical protein
MFNTVSKPLAHLNFLSGVNCYDIGSIYSTMTPTPQALTDTAKGVGNDGNKQLLRQVRQ